MAGGLGPELANTHHEQSCFNKPTHNSKVKHAQKRLKDGDTKESHCFFPSSPDAQLSEKLRVK